MPKQKSNHKEIIGTLKKGNFFIECPSCSEEIQLKNVELFDNDNFTNDAIEIYQGQLESVKAIKDNLKKIKSIGATKSETGALSTNMGLILERMAPLLNSFRFNHNDCRSIFNPIDYVIFDGLTETGTVKKIYFVDIKTGYASLSSRQKEIKSLILSNKVTFKKII